MKARCGTCFHHCLLEEGRTGLCRARTCRDGEIVCESYGRLTSLALDPIEKKPLNHFHPGSFILSAGSYGCNLRCPFCQNHEISFAGEEDGGWRYVSPEKLAALAAECRDRGNIGVAFTYNEPLTSWEYIRDAGKLVREAGMYNVLVTNGTAEPWVLEELRPCVDAMNVDLKGFRPEYYRDVLGGDLETVKTFITKAAEFCHVELTTLIVPGLNDSEEEMREMTAWIASLDGGRGREIPYHISRFFPRHRMTDRKATPVRRIYELADIAREKLRYVYTGNC